MIVRYQTNPDTGKVELRINGEIIAQPTPGNAIVLQLSSAIASQRLDRYDVPTSPR